MTQNKENLQVKLLNQESQQQSNLPNIVQIQAANQVPTINVHHVTTQYQGMQLKRPNTVPVITLSGLSLIILCPVIFSIHLFIAQLSSIPKIQYVFVTLLVSFIINYVFVIRKYQISPFLTDQSHDTKLKIACLLGFIGILCSVAWGWNGSGGLIFAMFWEKFRGNKIGTFKFLYLFIIIGSLLMQKHYTFMKIIEFIPGILFGIANSIVFQLKQSSTYTLTHQFIFLSSICMPMFFPATHTIVPNLWQWIVMIVTGLSMYFTILCTVKLMQKQRVSIVMSVVSGIVMIGTSSYFGMIDFVGATLIFLGIVFIIKKQFLDLEF